MSKKILVIFIILTAVAVTRADAETVSRREAMNIAESFFKKAKPGISSAPKFLYNGKDLTTHRLFPPFYVYGADDNAYVIVAAENKAFPVLGYSLSGTFDKHDLDTRIMAMLRNYARDVELIRYDGRIPVDAIAAWISIDDYLDRLINDTAGLIEIDGGKFLASATEFQNLEKSDAHETYCPRYEESDGAPFLFHEKFVRDSREALVKSQLMIDEISNPAVPVIRCVGGGHFEISIPEEVSTARVFDLKGMQLAYLTFESTNLAVVKLDAFPSGYYLLLLTGKSGKSYGMKVYK